MGKPVFDAFGRPSRVLSSEDVAEALDATGVPYRFILSRAHLNVAPVALKIWTPAQEAALLAAVQDLGFRYTRTLVRRRGRHFDEEEEPRKAGRGFRLYGANNSAAVC